MSHPDFNLELQALCGTISHFHVKVQPSSQAKCARPMSPLPASLFCIPFIQIHYRPPNCLLSFLYFTKELHFPLSCPSWNPVASFFNSPPNHPPLPTPPPSNQKQSQISPEFIPFPVPSLPTAQATILLLELHLSGLGLLASSPCDDHRNLLSYLKPTLKHDWRVPSGVSPCFPLSLAPLVF